MSDLSGLGLEVLLDRVSYPPHRPYAIVELRRRFSSLERERDEARAAMYEANRQWHAIDKRALAAERERDEARKEIAGLIAFWGDYVLGSCNKLIEVERERERLREALRPFAAMAEAFTRWPDARDDEYEPCSVRIADLRLARAALSEGGADATDDDCTFPDCAEGESASLCEGPCKRREGVDDGD